MLEFPTDADGNVLRRLQKSGVDLTKSRLIDFYCYAKNSEVAGVIVIKAKELGYDCEITRDEDDPNENTQYSVYMKRTMVPEYSTLMNCQEELNNILIEFDTVCDGWGTLHG